MKPRILLLALCFSQTASSKGDEVGNNDIVPLVRFLEDQPLHAHAPKFRALMLRWEDGNANVVDVVCPGVLFPLPDEKFKYNGELLAQFVLGGAAYQIENPEEKGKLIPQQLAGMRSMLKAYRSFVLADPDARQPALDSLAAGEAAGTLEGIVQERVAAECNHRPPGGD